MSNNNRIYIDTSINQVHEEQAEWIVAQSPVERIRETVQLILRVYGMPNPATRSIRIFIDKA